MAREEDQYDYTGEAIKAAKKAKEEAEARAAAKGKSPKSPNKDQIAINVLQILARGREDIVRSPNLLFAQGMSQNASERFQARFGLFELRYPVKSLSDAKTELDTIWSFAEANKIAPTEILETFPNKSPKDIVHSAVAAELVTRETILNIDPKIGGDPRMWYQELERAYLSIDFTKINAAQADELHAVFAASFDKMRILEKNVPGLEVPKKDDVLWKGLGDYYLSEAIPEDLQPPTGINNAKWNSERGKFNTFLLDLQIKLSKPHTQNQEKVILETAQSDLEAGDWNYFKDRAQATQRRLTVELEEFSDRKEATQAANSAEAKAARIEATQFIPNPPREGQYFMLPHLDRALITFHGAPEAQNKFKELDQLFLKDEPSALWDAKESQRLATAQKILTDIENQFHGGMSPEQQRIIDEYRNDIRNRMEQTYRMDDAPNRLYLLRMEKEALDNAPIGTMEQMFLEAMKAYIKDPNGPRAKFLFDRLELAQYYVFSKQHTAKLIDIYIVDNPEEFWKAVDVGGGSLKMEHLTPEQVQVAMDKHATSITKEKENYERSLSSRLHQVTYQQQWKHTSEYSDEQWFKFINTGLLEDDYWGMDGQFGGLIKRVRMKLKTKYEGKMFDENGDSVAHMDRLFDEAIKELTVELQDEEKYPELVGIWESYMRGDYFTEVPGAGIQSLLGTSRDSTTGMSYHDGIEIVTQFASYRMIMNDEKYILDGRFDPIMVGVDRGEIELPEGPMEVVTQFLEKQKVVKLFKPYDAQIRTWSGATLGDTGEEKLEMRERAKIVRNAFPEIDSEWAKEWSDDWWKTKVEPILGFDEEAYKNLNPDQQKKIVGKLTRDYGDIKSLFTFALDKYDQPPKIKDFSKKESRDKAIDWLKNNLNKKKFEEEVRFNAAMQISDMIYGEGIYMGVWESGARRNAGFSMLTEVLDGNKDLAKQNFLTFTELESAQSYFGVKQTLDTEKMKKGFLEDQKFIARYAPHGRLLVLREGNSLSFVDWVEKNVPDGKKGFRKFYTDLSDPFEDIFAKLALHEQIDYSKGVSGLNEEQKLAAGQVFLDRNMGNADKARDEMKTYFERMKKATDYLLGENAIAELTNVRYGPLLWRMRRDDYPYEYMQFPERALTRLMQIKGHPLYDEKAAELIRQKAVAERAVFDTKHKLAQAIKDKNEGEIKAAQHDLDSNIENTDAYKLKQITDSLQPYIKKKPEGLEDGVLDKILNGSKARFIERFMTRVTDKLEPQSSQDEQSGLFRRNKRDEAGHAANFSLMKDSWNVVNDKKAAEAQQKIYNSWVGMVGNTAATNIVDLDIGQRLAVQLAYPQYRPFLIGMADSAPIRKVKHQMKAKLPDELLYEFEVAKQTTGGSARYTAPDSLGIEYAVKKTLGVTNWNGIFGGMTKRDEWIDEHKTLAKFFTRKRVDNIVEWFDHHIPLGVWKNNFIVGLGMTALFLVLYTFQTAGGEEKKHK